MTVSGATRYAMADRPGSATSDPWIVRRVLAGWSPTAIAVAAGVSKRTAYRWIREIEAVEEVRIGSFVASFAICRTRPPFRLEPWRRIEP